MHSTVAVRDLEEMSRVVPRVDAQAKNRVVAGYLALSMETIRRDPKQRIEPVRRARQLCHRLKEPVHALYVRQFVRDHDKQPLVGPLLESRRQEQLRAE